MSRLNSDDRQLVLNFNVAPVRIESAAVNEPKVVRMNDFVRSRQPSIQSTPVLERLLQEAEKLRW